MTTHPQICGTGFSCGLDAALHIISGKWKPLVLFFLRDGSKRYGELKRVVQGVSDKVLIQQLKDLEADGVLLRTDYKEVPPRVDYALTPLGRSLADALVPLCTWGAENMAEVTSIASAAAAAAAAAAADRLNPGPGRPAESTNDTAVPRQRRA